MKKLWLRFLLDDLRDEATSTSLKQSRRGYWLPSVSQWRA